MKIVLIGEQKQPTVIKERVEDGTDPPVFVDVGGLGNGYEIDTDVLALGFEKEHVRIEFLHRVGFAAEHFGVPAIIRIKYLPHCSGSRSFGSPRF